jgi:outer membrane protein assembly factor BamD
MEAVNQGKPPAPAAAVTPTGANEPPRSDQPSNAPVEMQAPSGGGSGVGVEVISAPSSSAAAPDTAADPNAVVKGVGPTNTVLPAAEKPAEAPIQTNDIKHGENPAPPTDVATNGKTKKPKADLSEDSSSKKKKKKGLAKLNPF